MSRIRFEDGTVVNFEGIPTPEDVEEVAQQIGVRKAPPLEPQNTATPPTFLQQVGGAVGNVAKTIGGFVGDVARTITKPIATSIVRPYQLEERIRTGETPTVDLPFFGKIEPPKSFAEAVGTGLKTVSTGLGPISGGATFFGGEALEKGKSLPEAGLYATGGAAFGGVTRLAGAAIQKIPAGAWGAILKRVPTEALKNPNLERQIAEKGMVALSKKQLLKKAGQEIQDAELKISELLEGKEGVVSTKEVASRLSELKKSYSNIPGEQSSVEIIENVEKELLSKGEKLSLESANQLKRDIYGLVQKTYGKGLLEVPAKKEAQKMIARGLKEEIEKIIPEVKDVNARQAVFLQVRKALERRIAREEGKGIAGTGIGLYDILVGVGGATTQPFGTGVVGGGLGALAFKKAAESPAFLTTVSAGSQKLINFFEGLSPTQKVMFYNAVRGLSEETLESM